MKSMSYFRNCQQNHNTRKGGLFKSKYLLAKQESGYENNICCRKKKHLNVDPLKKHTQKSSTYNFTQS